MYKENPIRSIANFSAETVQTRKEWHDKIRVLKGKCNSKRQPTMLSPARLFTNGEIKNSPNKS